jgi:hypothetical protein
LLLLTRLLLATLLLLTALTGLRLAALLLLTTLLTTLLTRLLVWILVHRSFLSNIGSPLRSLVFPWQESIRGSCIRSKILIEENVSGTCPNLLSSLLNKENRRWDATCCCGCLECQFRFWS